MQIEYVNPEELKTADYNPRTISRKALRALAALLEAHGFVKWDTSGSGASQHQQTVVAKVHRLVLRRSTPESCGATNTSFSPV
jgi:hypothetical protein